MNKLKVFRTEAGLTQKAVATAVGTTQQTYQRWEQGRSKPDIDAIQNLAIFFRTSITSLFGIADGTAFGFALSHHIASGDDTGYWGNVGLHLPGRAHHLWYPISAQESERVERLLRAEPDETMVISTLNNRILAFCPLQMLRIQLLDEACDAPAGDPWFEEDHSTPRLPDQEGLPSSFYRAAAALAALEGGDGNGDEERLGPEIMSYARKIVAESGLSLSELDVCVNSSRFHMIDGSVLTVEPEPEHLYDVIGEYDGGDPPALLGYRLGYGRGFEIMPSRNVMMIDASLIAYRTAADAISEDED